MLKFDEHGLLRLLSNQGKRVRTAAALACAERLRLGFCRFCSQVGWDESPYLQALCLAWATIVDEGAPTSKIASAREMLLTMVPDDADDSTNVPDIAFGQDATSALIYAIECQLDGGATEAMWAMRCAYNSADTLVGRLSGGAYESEELILAHPFIQAELERQSADLADLTLEPQVSAERILLVRDRAARDANAFVEPFA